ncbi:hypothetical protein SUNI508_09952 [Seiridium unicorne]|uniref:DUF1993 domain-containing protein n=1 Tax=Seiridium unicorne TaxID=138068 RepID=A0ABR2UN55_9PEZI
MSEVSIYDISVGTYIGGLTVLVNILKKAALQPDADTLPSASLIEDMLPLSFQVQSVSNSVSVSLKRLLKTDIQSWEDNETTMEQLIERAENTLSLLKNMDPKTLMGAEKNVCKVAGEEMTGRQFILDFAMPNLFFHLQTAYAILRMKGVPLGKGDFMGPWHPLQNLNVLPSELHVSLQQGIDRGLRKGKCCDLIIKLADTHSGVVAAGVAGSHYGRASSRDPAQAYAGKTEDLRHGPRRYDLLVPECQDGWHLLGSSVN